MKDIAASILISLQASKRKDEQMSLLQSALSERDQALKQMVERYNDSVQTFEQLKQAYLQLQTENRSLKEVISCKPISPSISVGTNHSSTSGVISMEALHSCSERLLELGLARKVTAMTRTV